MIDPELANRLSLIFGGLTAPFAFIWKETGWPGWKHLDYNGEEYLQYIDPLTGRVFQGVGYTRISAAVRDSRSYACLEFNAGTAPGMISLQHVAVDARGEITGVYTTENDCPTLKPGWHTPAEVIQDGIDRGYGQFGTNRLESFKKLVPTALRVRWDPVTDTFNAPVEPLPLLPF